jgi:putative transposase
MNERVKFIARYLQKDEPFNALCERAGVSRETGYKWVERYEGGGVTALVDRSRAPLSHPHAVSAAVVETIVAMRRSHPRWGPRKLLAVLRRQEPSRAWPVASTVGDILRQRGLVRRRRRRAVQRAVCRASRRLRRAECDLVCGFQRSLCGRRRALSPADHHGWL